MTHIKHITLIALVTLFGAAALGCDSFEGQDLTLAEGDTRFATTGVTSEAEALSASDLEVGDAPDMAGTLEDLSHTATTQMDGAGSEPVTTTMFEEAASDAPSEEPALPEGTVTETTVVEDNSSDEASEPGPIADIFEHGSEPVAWSPAGTYKLPAYGAGCRFTTDQVIQIPSNGLNDDSVVFQTTGGSSATLELVVATPNGQSLVAEVDMKRGLTGRSYRQAMGDASWTDKDGDHAGSVIDGTICFDEKLANGMDDVLAEFSLIVELDGLYYAMGGNVLLEGSQVAALEGFTVNAASAVDIDLR
mgnify:CR=1 FL=1